MGLTQKYREGRLVTVVPFLACIPAYTSLIADLVNGSL